MDVVVPDALPEAIMDPPLLTSEQLPGHCSNSVGMYHAFIANMDSERKRDIEQRDGRE